MSLSRVKENQSQPRRQAKHQVNTQIQNGETVGELVAATVLAEQFYRDAERKSRNPRLKLLFNKIAGQKKLLANNMMLLAPDADAASVKTKSLSELKKTLKQIDTDKAIPEERYIEKAKDLESRQVRLFLGFLDKDIAMTFKNTVRPYLTAIYRHEDMISRCINSRRFAS
jgi:hypothetical protein